MEGSLNAPVLVDDRRLGSGQCVSENGGTGMINVKHIIRAARLVAVLVAALAISACANKPEDNAQASAAGMATPGSQQDFVVNVGDRVFFETDSSELTPQSRATLDKQAQWLNNYSQYAVHRRRSRRRARHARIQHRARRPPGADRARLSDLARRRGEPHAHHLLRQGAAGRGVQRHFLLVAEPPRGHGAQRQFVRRLATLAEKLSCPVLRRASTSFTAGNRT